MIAEPPSCYLKITAHTPVGVFSGVASLEANSLDFLEKLRHLLKGKLAESGAIESLVLFSGKEQIVLTSEVLKSSVVAMAIVPSPLD